MKQRILLVISCAAIVVASVIGLKQFNSEKNAGNDLLMENVEALTAGEVAEVTKHSICYMNVTFDEEDSRVSTVTYCGGCSEVPYTTRNDQRICKVQK